MRLSSALLNNHRSPQLHNAGPVTAKRPLPGLPPVGGCPVLLGLLLLASLTAARSTAAINYDGEFDTEIVASDDITLSQSNARLGLNTAPWQLDLDYSYATFDVDYQPVPFDAFGYAAAVAESTHSFQASGRYTLTEAVILLGSVGLYDGFTDYRSLWLSEYYEQQYGTFAYDPTTPDDPFNNYLPPDPSGHNASVGLRWEYLPASGYAQLDLSYLRDTVAPGYEIDFDGLVRGRENLYSQVASLTLENILHKRVRALNQLSVTATTEREERVAWRSNLNIAIRERWVARLSGGYTQESPNFEAVYGGLSLDYELSDAWILEISGKYYTDTGELINDGLFSTAAPSVNTRQIGAGLRWVTDTISAKVYLAAYESDYDEEGRNPALDFFQNLYSDRDWVIFQFALYYDF